jgi:hypothetical protein
MKIAWSAPIFGNRNLPMRLARLTARDPASLGTYRAHTLTEAFEGKKKRAIDFIAPLRNY